VNPLDDALPTLLARLQLTALRDRLDTLLDEAARRDLNLREALTFLCQAEVARREQRRLEMATRLAKFPFARALDGFDFEAQPSLDPRHPRGLDRAVVRRLLAGDWVRAHQNVLVTGPTGVGKPQPTDYPDR
jgi:DNA replication protein DnaC